MTQEGPDPVSCDPIAEHWVSIFPIKSASKLLNAEKEVTFACADQIELVVLDDWRELQMRDGTSMTGATVEEVRMNKQRNRFFFTSVDIFVSVPEKMEKRGSHQSSSSRRARLRRTIESRGGHVSS
jgi:hypothetical protein